MFDHTIITLAGIAFIAVGCQWLAWRLRLPVVLLLLGAGAVMGPVNGFLQPAALFGDLLPALLSLAVAVVLFQGSLTFRLNDITGLGGAVFRLASVGALLNGAAITAAGHFLLGLPWALAALFGAIALVTGGSELLPLLRRTRPGPRLAALLRQEAAILAPLATLLAVLIHAGVVAAPLADPLLAFASTLLAGGALGIAGAYLLALLLRHHLLPPHLVNVTALALVVVNFTLANALEHEAGLLTVVVMGMVLANMKDLALREAVDFRESLSAMLLSLLLLLVAAQLEPAQLALPAAEVLLLLAVTLLLARPLAVILATLGSALSWRERLLAGWIAPRGIMATAVAALFALQAPGVEASIAAPLLPLTLLLVLASLLLQNLTAHPLGRLLGVTETEPRGVLIIGAHAVARAIARALDGQGVRAVLADTDWEDIQQARMDGLATYLGNPVSEQADRSLDLVGIGHLLAMSHRPALNALACQRYGSEFGADRVYSLLTAEERRASGKSAIGRQYAATRLFGGELTLTQLAGLLTRGGEIGVYTPEEAEQHSQLLPLFVLTAQGALRVVSGGTAQLQAEERLVALRPAATEKQPLRPDAGLTVSTPA
jgi:CPA1 family monovalent cation:H+ antiporter